MGLGFRPQHELVIHLAKARPRFYACDGSNVLGSKRVPPAQKEHPTAKPVGLMAELVRVVAPPGGVVLDPFAGSGSTGVACVETGRRFIGIEKDAAYFRTAKRRIAAAERSLQKAA
jgi:site-specific DNA-methyltransferase (adenine-specific)